MQSCIIGLSNCIDVTYDSDSYNTSATYGFSLLPGYGCNIEINRYDNGSYGTMEFTWSDPNILMFDSMLEQVESGTVLGMPVVSYGWAPRSVFVVNSGTAATEFTGTFNEGEIAQRVGGLLLVVAAVASMLV